MIWEESFQNSLSKVRYLVCSFLCWTAECFLMWYQIVPIQNWQWVDQEVENLFYNILLVKAEKDSHKFEFLFTDLMFSFTSICLDGTLTPSKTNHMFLLLIWLRRALLPLRFVVALQYWRKVALQPVFMPIDMLWCLFVWAFFQFAFQFTIPLGVA